MDERIVELGRVVAAHGIAGEVAVRTLGDSPGGIARYESVVWAPPKGEPRRLAVERVRLHKGLALVTFRDVKDRDEAEALVGGVLTLTRSELKPAGEGRYYVVDLIGLAVETTDGRRIGVVTDLIDAGANDVYVIDAGEREVLVPAVDHIVKKLDPENGRIVIEALDGLLD